MASIRFEPSRYLQEVLPAALDQARQQIVTDYKNSSRFEARLLAEYKKEMKDMKANFTLANPTLIRLNWSLMLEISRET